MNELEDPVFDTIDEHSLIQTLMLLVFILISILYMASQFFKTEFIEFQKSNSTSMIK